MNLETGDGVKVLGIRFYNRDVKNAVDDILQGGLLVVPAAPALATMDGDPAYMESLVNSSIAIPDSGFMVLVWNLFHNEKLPKISGLKFLREFFCKGRFEKVPSVFLVNPTAADEIINQEYMQSKGFIISPDLSYIAPNYDKKNVEDKALVEKVETARPDVVLINIGGGTQEKLGYDLKKKLSYKPAIICTGAAISFLTGAQVSIPVFADRFYLGWLWRCISKPSIYIPRYLSGFKLFFDLIKYGSEAPQQSKLKK